MFFIKGILIGLILGMPVGAVGALCMSRTMEYGVKSGFVTGLGCSFADCFYAAVGAFGLGFISDFLHDHDTVMMTMGGFLITTLGIATLVKKKNDLTSIRSRPGFVKMFLSSFCIGITNPGAVLIFMTAFSYFGIHDKLTAAEGCFLIAGVFAGTLIWWFLLIGAVVMMRRRYGSRIISGANRVFGTIMIILGIAIFIKVFLIRK